MPPSSNPFEIYRQLHLDVKGSDKHSARIRDNKVGLLKGASIRKSGGEIDDATEQQISAAIDRAESNDFRPLLYVIPFSLVALVAYKVPVEEKAHPFSQEYILRDLRSGSFDVLTLPL